MDYAVSLWTEKTKLEEIKKLYAPTLTNTEFAIFSEIGKITKLSPYLREIWAVKYGSGPASIFIGRDGYRKVAQEYPEYDWHFSAVVYVNDKFLPNNGEPIHEFSMKEDRGIIYGAFALCKRKNSSKPNYVFVRFNEYNTGKSVWKDKPETMIAKVAEAQVLRATFQGLFAGTYDESEEWATVPNSIKENAIIGESVVVPKTATSPKKPMTPKVKTETITAEVVEEQEAPEEITADQVTMIHALWGDITELKGWDQETSDQKYRENLATAAKVESSKDLSKAKASMYIEYLSKSLDKIGEQADKVLAEKKKVMTPEEAEVFMNS